MRVGVMFPCRLSPRRLVEYARRAEDAGLDELWVVEDCFFAGGIATAGAALAATSRLTVGIGILPAVARNPAFTAMELAALAELHPGRLVGGIGHGVPAWMRQVGAYPASPLTALDETLRAVRGLLAGETVSLAGLTEVALDFPPAVVPPVLAGVRGPRSLRVSGASADGTILAEPCPPSYVRWARDRIAEGGGTAAHRVVTYQPFAVADDPAVARAALRDPLAAALGPAVRPHLTGLPFADELAELVDAGMSGERLRDEWIDALAVCGTARDCLARLRELSEAGTDTAVLVPMPGSDESAAIAAAGRLAERSR
ncbi:MAG TPA: LLM class flavin-dependent oxidoreductase [Actinocatenispora sp.]